MNSQTTAAPASRHNYTSSEATDIRATLKRFGWTAPDRTRQMQQYVELNNIDLRMAALLQAQAG